MKMQALKIAAKRAAGTLLLSTVLFVSANAASLHEPVVKDTLDKNANVLSLGRQENHFLFKVKYNNVKGGKFNVSVKDKDGYVIFQESYTDKKFDKLFKISQEEEGNLTFTIKNLKDNTVNTFDINTTTRVYDQVMITKVD